MFVLSLLARMCQSVFWEFDPDVFPSLVENSFEKPIFLLCYATYCPHCRGLPELFRNFSETYAPGDDLIVTTLNCEENRATCRTLPMEGTPHITLVMGPDSHYWPVAEERTIESWAPWIAKFVGNQFREIKSAEDLEEAKREPTGGGATFVLEVSSAQDPVFDVLLPLTRVYRIYNDTFVYKVDPTLSAPRLSVFQNKWCGTEFKGTFTEQDLKQFIDVHRHGLMHAYRPTEFFELIQKETSIIYINDRGELSDSQIDGVMNMPNGLCSDVIFGWTHVEDQPGILEAIGLSRLELPILFGVNPSKKCSWVHRGRLAELSKGNFTETVLAGQCVNVFEVVRTKLLKTVAYLIGLVVFGCVVFIPLSAKKPAKKQD